MKFIENVDKEIFNNFVSKHPKGNVLQSSEWGEFKSIHEWNMHRVGLVDNKGELVAATLILSRKLPIFNKPILYAPRGFVIDFKDTFLLSEFIDKIKGFAKKLNAIFLKIDPDIRLVERDIEGNQILLGENNESLIERLTDFGFVHKGTELDFNGVQPRFVFRLNIEKEEEELLNHFHQKTRYNIKLAERKGIEIIEGTRSDLEKFTEIMEVTGKRDGFVTRPLSYFQEMYDTLVPSGNMKLFLAKYNIAKRFQQLEKELNDLENKAIRNLNDHSKLIINSFKETIQNNLKITSPEKVNVDLLLQQIEENEGNLNKKTKNAIKNYLTNYENLIPELLQLDSLNKQYPNGLIVSGSIALSFGDKTWYLYGASDNVYRNLMPNYLIQWEMIKWAKSKGSKIYDFRGISGDLSPNNHLYGLYKFKKGFNGEFTEFIGEFDLIFNKPLYYAWEVFIPKFKKIRRKVINRR